jgi:2,4-dienoyl-CoA reductase-like NADH-dependent reductase (Old Yellow Enzyme family)
MLTAFSGQSSTPTSLDSLVNRMERGEFDLIAVGRALLGDPDWVTRIRQGDGAGLKGFTPAALAELV